jgi:hypothetical protein
MSLKRLLGLARARQAFLLPTYARLYPELPAGEWIIAREVSRVIRRGVQNQQRPWPSLGPRVLADDHFLFRDGPTAVGRALRSLRAARRPGRRAGVRGG